MEELLNLFKERNVSIQITLDSTSHPVVHAIEKGDPLFELVKVEGETLLEALQAMEYKLFG